jgi:hypothetical protein
MVDTVIDPIRVPTITLSQSEIEDIEAGIAAGELPPDWLERHAAAVQANVFGHDHKKDKNGNPIEQGRGSESNMTAQAVAAYRKYGREEPDYQRHLSRMEKQLAACDEVRSAAAAARRKEARR